jgi:ribonuclease HI
MSKFYAVRKGIVNGIYTTWDEAKKQVHGFKGAEYKSFKTRQEAECYMNQNLNIIKTLNNIDILVYTDGSCMNKKGGYSYVIILNPNESINNHHILSDYGFISNQSTNNIAELYAIKQVLIKLIDHVNQSILIRSDSEYAIKILTGINKPVANLELISECMVLLSQFKNLTFEHVEAHVGEYYNEMVDKLAKQGAQNI